MTNGQLQHDPYNMIVAGVGGQGNVLASRLLGNMFSRKGWLVTIGETFGATQRGGSVMSHLRVSARGTWSPQIPHGQAHFITALEPTEALRVLRDYGHPQVNVVCNTRPIQPVAVISGREAYPELDQLKDWVGELSQRAWFIEATAVAIKLGAPIYANIIMIGALCGTGLLPLTREDFQTVLAQGLAKDKVAANLVAFDAGLNLVTGRNQA